MIPAPDYIDRVRAIATRVELRQLLTLCKSGVPFDVAASLTDEQRVAWCLAIGEIEGGVFDWNNWRWTERS